MLSLIRVGLDRKLCRSYSFMEHSIPRRYSSWLSQLYFKFTELDRFHFGRLFHLIPLILNDNGIVLCRRVSYAKVILSHRRYRSMGWSFLPSLFRNLGGRKTGEHLHHPWSFVAFLKDFNQKGIHIVLWLLASHLHWLLEPLFKRFDLHLCFVMSVCLNSFFVYTMVLASLDADEAIYHITKPDKVFRVKFSVKFERFFSKYLAAFFKALNQNQRASDQLQNVGNQILFCLWQGIVTLKQAPNSAFRLDQRLNFHNWL